MAILQELQLFLVAVALWNVAVCQQDSSENPYYHFCNSTIRDGQGILLSPNFPRLYEANSFCQWSITVEADRTIRLTFKSFEVEGSVNCNYDYIAIYDGPSLSHPQLGKFCGAFRPSDVVTTSNRMLVTFKTDDSTQKSGFFAVFVSETAQSATPNSCGGLMTRNEGSFHSVNFPKSNYPNGITCSWHIRTNENRQIVLTFRELALETSENCKYDAVTVLGGWSNQDESETLGRFCNIESTPGQIVSPGNEMFITFSSDSSGNDVGFSATYTTRKADSTVQSTRSSLCPETTVLTSNSGVIMNPGYKQPGGYASNLHCTWLIESPSDTQVILQFESFHLESDEGCIFDFVAVYSGRSESANSSEIGRYCGSMSDVEVRSSGNEMFIVFVSDSGGNAADFRALYTTESIHLPETTTSTQPTTISSTTVRPTFRATANLTVATPSGCGQQCPSPVNLPAATCSYNFLAVIKVLKIKTLSSGTVRINVNLAKVMKLNIPNVVLKKKAKIWLDVPCPSCFPSLVKRKRYIVAGMDISESGGQINSDDFLGIFTKKMQKIVKKSLRRCRRRNSRTRKRRYGKKHSKKL